MEGLISTRVYMGALCFLLFLAPLICFLRWPVVPPPQPLPDDGGAGNPSSFPHLHDNLVMGANASALASFFSGARNFVIKNFTILVLGYDPVAKGMKALDEHSMKGAAYDSSLRDPPPQCHPGTRVQLVENIVTWFRKNRREKALLWLNGPAGVGKSAVIQTVAESLAESKSVGATFFLSRLNNRNNPQLVFITLAFQLATQIPDYQAYITKKIALDPSLLEKGMKDQFRVFIAEPFGKRGIGKGKGPQAVLLDGLDECEGVEEQRRIVQLVTEFVLTFPDAPLVWAISSRPEPHIVGAFSDEALASSFWSEYVPVNSTQACRDVEHYLDARFKDMRKPFPHLPNNWPSETQFLKLARGAQGLFAFARTAVRFLEDPDYADPVSRLNLILSIIDHLDVKVIDDHPFALLDALYTHLVTSIPPSVWPITKRVLGFVICARSGGPKDGLSYPLRSLNRASLGMSIVFGLELSTMYGSLHKLYSVLNIPDLEHSSNSNVAFVHASFGDYLTDRARSKGFYIDRGESVDEITRCLFQLYLDNPQESEWGEYASQLSIVTKQELSRTLKEEAECGMYFNVTGKLRSQRGKGPFKSQQDRLECLRALRQINPIEIYKLGAFKNKRFCAFLLQLWDEFQEELEGTGLFKMVPMQDLEKEHLNHRANEIIPTELPEDSQMGVVENKRLGLPPESRLGRIQQYQRWNPKKPVVIYGGLPEERIAILHSEDRGIYCCFPYPY